MSEFAVPACASCGNAAWPPRLVCAHCGAAEWTAAPSPTGVLEEVTEVAAAAGAPLRLGTVRLAAGPPAIAVVDDDAAAGEGVAVELVGGALRARRERTG